MAQYGDPSGSANEPPAYGAEDAPRTSGFSSIMWYFAVRGYQEGPVPQAELLAMADRGSLQGGVVWREGMEEWTPSEFIPDIIQSFAAKEVKERRRKRTREVPLFVPPELEDWLADLDEVLLAGFFVLACDVPGFLHSVKAARDRLMRSYIERDEELDGDPDEFECSDEFFLDILDVNGPQAAWNLMYPGNEEDARKIIASAAKLDAELLNRIKSAHTFWLMTEAIRAGKLETVVSLLEESPFVMQIADLEGRSPLHLAVKAQEAKILQALIDFDAQNSEGQLGSSIIDDLDNKGNTALHIAADIGEIELAELLLDAGSDPNLQNNAGKYGEGWSKKVQVAGQDELQPNDDRDKTPLHIACENEDEAMAALLVARGADVNLTDAANMTALHHAIEENCESLVGFLLDNGADPALGNDLIGQDNTPLHACISRGRVAIAKLLLESGQFDVNAAAAGWLPLHLAARRGTVKAVNLLLEAGADPCAMDGDGRTAKDLAEKNNRKECVEILEEAMKKAGAAAPAVLLEAAPTPATGEAAPAPDEEEKARNAPAETGPVAVESG